jgi:hypothetical protein
MHIIPIEILARELGLGGSRLEDGQVIMPAVLLRYLLECALRAAPFDESAYLLANEDVQATIRQGRYLSAQEHFVTDGYFEGRQGTGPDFDEGWYLSRNPDVAEAVQAGVWSSGRAHYKAEGKFEWRSPNAEVAEEIDRWRRCFHATISKTDNGGEGRMSAQRSRARARA